MVELESMKSVSPLRLFFCGSLKTHSFILQSSIVVGFALLMVSCAFVGCVVAEFGDAVLRNGSESTEVAEELLCFVVLGGGKKLLRLNAKSLGRTRNRKVNIPI